MSRVLVIGESGTGYFTGYIVIRLGLGKLLVNLLQVVKQTNNLLIP